jgi:hypothetical protein
MQHRQTSELGRFVPWREISTIVQSDGGGFALASSKKNASAINNAWVSLGVLSGEPKGVSEKPRGVTRRRPLKSSNNLIEHEDASHDIYAASGPA